jgi:hypothetical protein
MWTEIGIALAQMAYSAYSSSKTSKISAAETADKAARDYNESVRGQKVADSNYKNSTARTYGSDFLSMLNNGADLSTLINTLGSSDTALGKEIQSYENNASQTVLNSMSSNKQAGLDASLQGQLDANAMQQLAIANEQSQGSSIASQSTSGIKANAGTGSNTQRIQEQANATAKEQMELAILKENTSTINSMKNTQNSALQTAEEYRLKSDLTAENAATSALNAYDNYTATMQDFDTEQTSLNNDYKYYKGESKGWLINESARIDNTPNLEADTLKFIDD